MTRLMENSGCICLGLVWRQDVSSLKRKELSKISNVNRSYACLICLLMCKGKKGLEEENHMTKEAIDNKERTSPKDMSPSGMRCTFSNSKTTWFSKSNIPKSNPVRVRPRAEKNPSCPSCVLARAENRGKITERSSQNTS
ncbi:hypothetical protein LXL04_024231 [Taraxacum kok-saghyz]